jgi:hypothetical protein
VGVGAAGADEDGGELDAIEAASSVASVSIASRIAMRMG